MTHRSLLAATAVVAALVLAGCADRGPSASGSAAASPASVTHLVEGQETARGTFVGLSDHETSGHGSVFWDGSNWVISLGSDFAFDGAPDPVVGFGRDDVYDGATTIGALVSDTGPSVYVVPAGVDVARYNQIFIWCEEFSVPLGSADLTLL